MTMLIQDTILI